MAGKNDFSDRTQYQPSGQSQTNGKGNYSQNYDRNDNANITPATSDEIAYREGYIDGQNQERLSENGQRSRENSSAATGILIGVIVASIAGLTLATLSWINQDRQPVTPAVNTPVSPTQVSPTPQPSSNTTIIQPVPQSPVPQQTQIIVPAQPNTQPVQPNSGQPIQPSTTQPGTPNTLPPDTTQPSANQPTTVPPSVLPPSTSTAPSTYPNSTGAVGQ